jgi:glycosyltransferase involved in cell wall biosynthesis
MVRFVGVKNNHIYVVSDKSFNNDGLQVLEVPSELSGVSAADLIVNCRVKNGVIKCKSFKKPANQIKLAMISNLHMECGLATYAESLFPEIAKCVGHFKLFIEKNDPPTRDIHQFGTQTLSDDQISICWKRGESHQQLIEEIKNYDPDVILINHEFGLFPNARHWLSLMTQLSSYRVIVIMHSVFPTHQDKMVYEASMPEIVVHLPGAKYNLENEKKVNAKVHMIPHGCYPIVNQNKLWDNYRSPHTFVQQGFLLRYKGWQLALEAVAILKEKYSDVFFTGLCSESPYAKTEHQIYYNELMTLAEKLGIKNNIALIRGFQPDLVLDTFYRSNKVAIFPYVSSPEHEVFGASGASRLAMSKGLPVITSSVNHFGDLNTIKADTPEQMANELDKLFSNEKLIEEQVEKQNQFIIDNSWENVAKQFVNLMENEINDKKR